MQNPYQPPQAKPQKPVAQKEDNFERASDIARWVRSLSFATFFLTALFIPDDPDSVLSVVRTVTMITAAGLVALSLLSAIPLSIWGFILGLRDARKSKKPWQ